HPKPLKKLVCAPETAEVGLVKGEPLAPPAGRADDFAWPRREIGREQARGETPVASTTPDAAAPGAVAAAAAKPAPQKRMFRPAPAQIQTNTPSLQDFFGGFGNAQMAPPRAPGPFAPRPPANV